MATWGDVERIASTLPETSVGLWYGRRALVVAGKGMLHLGEGDEPLSFPTPEKDELLAARPDVYRTTPHLDGSRWVLCDLRGIGVDELREHLIDAWREKAPKALQRRHPDL
jgi:hypothetical protein